MLLARERMQKKLDEDAAIYAKKKEEVRERREREREEDFFIEITTYNREKHRREMKRLNNGRHLKL